MAGISHEQFKEEIRKNTMDITKDLHQRLEKIAIKNGNTPSEEYTEGFMDGIELTIKSIDEAIDMLMFKMDVTNKL